MDMDSNINVDNKEQLQVEETDDSCRFDFIEIVPLARDTDGSCTTECDSGDWSAEVKEENLADVKQEPDDVCWITYGVIVLPQHTKGLQMLRKQIKLFKLFQFM